MKLIVPAFIILLGLLTGAVVYRFFKETATGFRLSVLAGGAGAFAGLLIRDFMDVTLGGPFIGALLAAILGAIVASAATNLFFGQVNKPN